jgi:hypothetical protein
VRHGRHPWNRNNAGILHAVVTTFNAVLRIEIDLYCKTLRTKVIEDHRGIYFGLTRCDRQILVAVRNLDITGRKQSPDFGTNVICSLDVDRGLMSPVLAHESLRDLHQIRAAGHWLCIVLDEGSQVAVFDRRSWRLARLIELAPLVPVHLRHGAPKARPTDNYHFNSLTFCGRRAFVLAHNWERGSFALEIDLHWGPDGPERPRVIAVREALGIAAHDVIYHRGTLHVLDSDKGALILLSHSERRLSLSHGEKPIFPRGMALSRRYILACYGTWSAKKEGRERSESRVCVIDRATQEIILDAAFGNYGNPCDILLLSPPDLSDAGTSFRSAIAMGWLAAAGRNRR